MNLISSYRHRYRLYQSYSRHPRLSMVSDVAKNACLVGIVTSVAWFGFSVATQGNQAPDRIQSLAAAPQQSITHKGMTVAKTRNLNQKFDVRSDSVVTATAPDRADTTTLKPLASGSDEPLVSSKVEIPASASLTRVAANHNKIHESDWIFLLPSDKFIIQLGSSPDWELVYEEATAFPTGPVAIFPFKKTPSKRIVYGYSSGIYNSLDEARRAIETFPKSVVANGTWIRPVSTLQKQIMNLSVDS